jgi:hypothetical protein
MKLCIPTFILMDVLYWFGIFRVNKENRSAGVLENYAEGEAYAEHKLRKFLRNRSPEVMPSVNKFFSDPEWMNESKYFCIGWLVFGIFSEFWSNLMLKGYMVLNYFVNVVIK